MISFARKISLPRVQQPHIFWRTHNRKRKGLATQRNMVSKCCHVNNWIQRRFVMRTERLEKYLPAPWFDNTKNKLFGPYKSIYRQVPDLVIKSVAFLTLRSVSVLKASKLLEKSNYVRSRVGDSPNHFMYAWLACLQLSRFISCRLFTHIHTRNLGLEYFKNSFLFPEW